MCLPLNVKPLTHLMPLWLQWARTLHWSLLLLLLKAFQDSQRTAWFLPADNWALHCKSENGNQQNCMGIGFIPTPKPGQNRKVKPHAASLQHVFLRCLAVSNFKSKSRPALMSKNSPWPVIQANSSRVRGRRKSEEICYLTTAGWENKFEPQTCVKFNQTDKWTRAFLLVCYIPKLRDCSLLITFLKSLTSHTAPVTAFSYALEWFSRPTIFLLWTESCSADCKGQIPNYRACY